jgi:enoyl-CoA hydratase
MEGKYVSKSFEENICIVKIDRPPVNTLNSNLMAELTSTFTELSDNPDLRAVVLTAKGQKAFIAGADIAEVKTLSEAEATTFSAQGQSMTIAIANCPVPVICAINGLALGGGCEVALACDIRIIVDDAIIGLPEASLGLLPGAGGTQRLPNIIAPGMAKLMLFTATPITSSEAVRCGLVEKSVPRESLMDTCLDMARKIASNGPLAIKAIKLLARKSSELPIEDGLAIEQVEFGKLCTSKDKAEGINAFFEKRKPMYTGG